MITRRRSGTTTSTGIPFPRMAVAYDFTIFHVYFTKFKTKFFSFLRLLISNRVVAF